jgi:ribosome recycling factor
MGGGSMKEEILKESKEKMAKVVENLKKEYSKLRTGRATPALLEGIKVECYGTLMPLEQVASISAPEPRLITIQPWDQSISNQIEKAILKSELGLTPNFDGKVIRIAIPPLTGERRKDLVKVAKKMAEDAKVIVRNHRRDANEALKKLKNDKILSEDDLRKAQDQVQKFTDEHIKKLDQTFAEKEKEIMSF